MYASINYRTKKALKEAIAAGVTVTVYSPYHGVNKSEGVVFLEGPHYPAAHTWYARAAVVDGKIVKVV